MGFITAATGRLGSEIRRRRVPRVAATYTVAGAGVVGFAAGVAPYLGLPPFVVKDVFWTALAGLPATILFTWIRHADAAALRDPQPSESPADATVPSIAVLPFVNMSADPDTDFFSDGIAEEILDSLARIEGLRVVARTSSFSYRGREQDVRAIGRELGVGTVLEGSVRRDGADVRITAQLIDAHDGSHLFSRSWDRELAGIFQVQEEIARAIARTLRVELVGEEHLVRGATADVEAHADYLQAQQLRNERTPESLEEALERYEAALGRDPNYALAQAGRAGTLALLADLGARPQGETLAEAARGALRALEIDDDVAEGHAALGFVRMLSWEWRDAERHLRRALEMEPEDVTTRHWYSVLLSALGRLDEAIAQIRRAQSLDPLSPSVYGAAAGLWYYARDPERALQTCERTLELSPVDLFALVLVGLAHEQAGRTTEAIDALDRAASVAGERHPYVLAARGHVQAIRGDQEEAREALALLEAGPDFPFGIAALRLALGEADGALRALGDAVEQHDGWVAAFAIHPWLDALRGDARYGALLSRVGLQPSPARPSHAQGRHSSTRGTS